MSLCVGVVGFGRGCSMTGEEDGMMMGGTDSGNKTERN